MPTEMERAPAGVSATSLWKRLQTATKLSERKAKQLQTMKEKGAEVGEKVVVSVISIGTGAGIGWIQKKYPGQWMKVDKELWIGAPMLLLGLTGLLGEKASYAVLAAGNSVMAIWTAGKVKSM